MNDKLKIYKRIAIATLVCAVGFFLALLIPKSAFASAASMHVAAGIMGVGTAIFSTVCWLKYSQERKKIKEKELEEQRKKAEYDEAMREFDEWLKEFEPLTKIAAELIHAQPGSEQFSKFGGLPVVPVSFEWPTYKDKPIPFLLQLDFSQINAEGTLKNFPASGYMYVFVDDVECEEQYRVVFFESVSRLEEATAPQGLETKYREIYVTHRQNKTYPDVLDCDEAFRIYCARPHGGMDDGYDALCGENTDSHLIGGWPSHLQGGGFIKECREGENDKWVLLMQIKSEYTKSGEGDFMWGDAGIIYLYVREEDLLARNFDNIKIEMQCY